MRKAVSLVKSLLKFPKAKRKGKSEPESSNNEDQERIEPKPADITIIKPCSRCILAYENKIWSEVQTQLLLQGETGLNTEMFDEANICPGKRVNPQENEKRIRSLLRYYHLVEVNGQECSVWSDRSCMSSSCLQGHAFWSENGRHDFDSHFPVFIVMTETACWQAPLLFEEPDLILMRSRLSVLCSLLDYNLQPSKLTATNVEVWVLITKLQPQSVFLEIEDTLVNEVLDHFVLIAFLNLPLSKDKRTEHLEALFQAVDNIMDTSSYIVLASGDTSELETSVKEAIIETATMVTSTVAESTATVGIETAAMAMGQAAAGVALSVLVDIAITAGTVTRAKIKRDKGLISNREFKTTVRHKLCDSGCQFIMGTTGTIVGQVLIPVPIVGAIVGGFCGSLIGAGVSKGIIKTSEIISKAQASRAKAITDK